MFLIVDLTIQETSPSIDKYHLQQIPYSSANRRYMQIIASVWQLLQDYRFRSSEKKTKEYEVTH